MSGADAGEAAGLGFDRGAEIVVAPCALLLEIGPNSREVVVGQGFVQQGAGFCR